MAPSKAPLEAAACRAPGAKWQAANLWAAWDGAKILRISWEAEDAAEIFRNSILIDFYMTSGQN